MLIDICLSYLRYETIMNMYFCSYDYVSRIRYISADLYVCMLRAYVSMCKAVSVQANESACVKACAHALCLRVTPYTSRVADAGSTWLTPTACCCRRYFISLIFLILSYPPRVLSPRERGLVVRPAHPTQRNGTRALLGQLSGHNGALSFIAGAIVLEFAGHL